ncbi:hypothetical protein [Chondromyces apiculatus]|nr:hypothetical protein [Chondromyces apiculatus]
MSLASSTRGEGLGPPLSLDEQPLIARIDGALARALPISDGPYTLALTTLPDEERARLDGQSGPVLYTRALVHVALRLTGLDATGAPRDLDHVLTLCERTERDLDRLDTLLAAFVRVVCRLMRDAQDTSLGAPARLLPSHLDAALRAALRASVRKPRKTRTVDACEAAMLEAPELQDLLVPPPETIAPAVAALDAWFTAHVPVMSTPDFELTHVREPRWPRLTPPSPQGIEATRKGLCVTIRTTAFDAPDAFGERPILDAFEQQILLVDPASLSDVDRVIAYLDGWSATLPRVVAHWHAKDKLADRMPCDFLEPSVLDLKKPRTAEDFAAALAKRWKLPAG